MTKLNFTLLIFLVFPNLLVIGQESAEDLAKAAQNPVSDIMSFPFQNNTYFNYGYYNRVQDVLNIQPVIPFFKGRLITRTIFPLMWQPGNEPSGTTFGLSNVQFAGIYSPKTKNIIVGLGPIVQFPATGTALGTQKWSAGPAFVILGMPGHWVIGLLCYNIWSFAGPSDSRAVNQMMIQYFVNYNFKKGFYISMAPIITADWTASAGNQWFVPFGAGVGKLFRIGGKLPLNTQIAGFYNAIRPDYAPDWTLRIQVQVLLPTYVFNMKKHAREAGAENPH